ncbi:MAG: indole-3-glycerol phosphate synthase TrpC [Actinobacteria bacterium]|nr:indole-3-glycerol phosphate synthase TrpC [Actinomycetota bacterium]
MDAGRELAVLEEIVASTRRRIGPLIQNRIDLRAAALSTDPALGFADALAAPGFQIIAEIKRKSPSAGVLTETLVPEEQAVVYVDGGAAAISVLTEPEFFAGSVADLQAVREAVDIPLLRKDFVVDSAQIYETKVLGADAVLLIVAILTDDELARLYDAALSVGLDVLVETHTEHEVERALEIGPQIVGVNNRDLATFVTDLGTAERIAPRVVGRAITVGESGVSSVDGARRMRTAGFDAILVGEALVRADDPAALIAELRAV